jgi:hypothetical protein
MVVLFCLWTKVKIFLVFVKLELPDVFLLTNPIKMTLKGALKFLIRLAEENFVIHVRDACIFFVTLHSRTF